MLHHTQHCTELAYHQLTRNTGVVVNFWLVDCLPPQHFLCLPSPAPFLPPYLQALPLPPLFARFRPFIYPSKESRESGGPLPEKNEILGNCRLALAHSGMLYAMAWKCVWYGEHSMGRRPPPEVLTRVSLLRAPHHYFYYYYYYYCCCCLLR